MPVPFPRVPLSLGVVVLVVLGGVLFLLYRQQDPGWVKEAEPQEDVVEKSFDGGSDRLSQTQIVPTLDTPISEEQSAIWCASFQIAWNELRRSVVKGPVRIRNVGD